LPPQPQIKIRLGLCTGLGFALAHVLTIFVPMVFDQPTSVDIDDRHWPAFPNTLDLALVYNFISVWHLSSGLLFVRFMHYNFAILTVFLVIVQFGVSALTLVPVVAWKLLILFLLCYGMLIFALLSFRSMHWVPVREVEDALVVDVAAEAEGKRHGD
jgi:hypothetical protein